MATNLALRKEPFNLETLREQLRKEKGRIQTEFQNSIITQDRSLSELALELSAHYTGRECAFLLEISDSYCSRLQRYARFYAAYPSIDIPERTFRDRFFQFVDRAMPKRRMRGLEEAVFERVVQAIEIQEPILRLDAKRKKPKRRLKRQVLSEEAKQEIRDVFEEGYDKALDELEGLLAGELWRFTPQSIGIQHKRVKEFRQRVLRYLYGPEKQ